MVADNAGKRDRQITLQIKSVARDGVGQPKETWTTVRKLWASRLEGSVVSERFAGNQLLAEIDTVFRVGWFPALRDIGANTHRIMFKGKAYNIQGVSEIGRNQGLEMLCTARNEGPTNG